MSTPSVSVSGSGSVKWRVKRQRQWQWQGPIGMHCDAPLDAPNRSQIHFGASRWAAPVHNGPNEIQSDASLDADAAARSVHTLTPLPSIAMVSGYTDLCHQTEAVPWKQRYYDSLSLLPSIAMGSGYTDHPRVGRSDGRLLLPDVLNFLSSK